MEKKPEILIQYFIEFFTDKNDIVIDFHLGSGTTCAVAHKINRQYIGIEQLNYGKNDSVIRLNNVIKGDQTGISKDIGWSGGGSFIYCELKKLNQDFIDKIEKAKTKKDLLKTWELMNKKSFLSYKVDISEFQKNAAVFDQLTIENQKKFLLEVLDKNFLYVNYSEIEDKDYSVSEEDKRLNSEFYK